MFVYSVFNEGGKDMRIINMAVDDYRWKRHNHLKQSLGKNWIDYFDYLYDKAIKVEKEDNNL